MKEFMKSKKGKIIVGVIALLILLAIVLGIIFSGSTEKGDKEPNNITIELGEDENDKAKQEASENADNGLEVGDSLSESEDTLSVSEEEKETNDSTTSNQEKESEGDETTSDDETTSETQEPENNEVAPEKTFGELY